MASDTAARLVAPTEEQDDKADPALRPVRLEDFTGQAESVRQLRICVDGALARGEAMDHVLLFGPPGLGKTTLASIVAKEMGFEFLPTSAASLTKPGDLASLLMTMMPDTVFFIDEIHRLNKVAAELLYTAMEDRHIDLIVGEGASARPVRFDLPAFTLVGATTRAGMLPRPLLDRFGIQLRLEFYNDADLTQILARSARLMQVEGSQEALMEIASRARGTPRVAKRLLRRVRDFAHSAGAAVFDVDVAQEALELFGIDRDGLDPQDRRYMDALMRVYGGGPAGIEAICATIAEDRDIIESQVEPYLMARGLVQRTRLGRSATDVARKMFAGATTPGQGSGPATVVQPPSGGQQMRLLGFETAPGNRQA